MEKIKAIILFSFIYTKETVELIRDIILFSIIYTNETIEFT